MATVMASPRRPQLPAGQAPGNVTNVRMGHISHQSNNSPHNQTHEEAPPLPSRPIHRQAFETKSFVDRNTAKAFSDPDRHRIVERTQSESSQHHYHHQQQQRQQQQQHSGHVGNSHSHGHTAVQSKTLPRQRNPQTAGDSTPPPPPSSRPPTRPPPQYETAPPPPPASRPPERKQQSHTDKSTAVPDKSVSPTHATKKQPDTREVSPSLPPTRPPKTSDSASPSIGSGHTGAPVRPPKGHLHTAHSVDETAHIGVPERPPKGRLHSAPSVDVSDFETRFRFHEPHDFPEPETSVVSPNKSYPSQSASTKRKSQKVREGKLGPL